MVRLLTKERMKNYSMQNPLSTKILLPFVVFEHLQNKLSEVYELVIEDQPVGIFTTVGFTTFLYLIKPVTITPYLEEIKVFCEGVLLADSSFLLDKESLNIIDRPLYYEKTGFTMSQSKTHDPSLYQTLKDAFSIMKSWEDSFEFDSYYVNTHHYIRHGYARVENCYRDKEVVATAMVCGVSNVYGFIQNVGVKKGEQGKGYGKETVMRLLQKSSFQKVGLFCSEDNEGFYNKLGFTKKGQAMTFLL